MFDETLLKIAKAAVDANKNGALEALIETYYAHDVVSIEAADNPGMSRAAEGLEALKGKHDWWNSTMDMHASEVEGPYLFAPDRFAIRFTIDATNRDTGEHMLAAEIGLYTIANGKIVREEFFSAPE